MANFYQKKRLEQKLQVPYVEHLREEFKLSDKEIEVEEQIKMIFLEKIPINKKDEKTKYNEMKLSIEFTKD